MSEMGPDVGVSFVVPVLDGEPGLTATLEAILAQDDGRPFEVLVVDDGSRDGSWRNVEQLAAQDDRVVHLEGRCQGAAAALNVGVHAARHPVICQVDQDVEVRPGWLAELLAVLAADPRAGAAQGLYVARPGAPLLARVAALDLEQRYAALHEGRSSSRGDRVSVHPVSVNHVCTGTTAYRRDALLEVGLFDESLGYGYDNDLSYRLKAAGWRLYLCRAARSVHAWPEDLAGYWRQQYGQGYGRLDLVAKHRGRLAGDDVSGPLMMLHAPVMAASLASLGGAAVLKILGRRGAARRLAGLGLAGVSALAGERVFVGAGSARRTGDPAGLAFAPVHLVRDTAWVAAIARWSLRRLLGRRSEPGQSMRRSEDRGED